MNLTVNSSSSVSNTLCKVELSNCPGQAEYGILTDSLFLYMFLTVVGKNAHFTLMRLLGSHDGDGNVV